MLEIVKAKSQQKNSITKYRYQLQLCFKSIISDFPEN